jgi:hypothetical protein
VARALVVEGEAVAVVTELDDAAGVRVPARGVLGDRLCGGWLAVRGDRSIRGLQRVVGEQVLEVGEDQLLVLLLVVQAELGAQGELGRTGRSASAWCMPRSMCSR